MTRSVSLVLVAGFVALDSARAQVVTSSTVHPACSDSANKSWARSDPARYGALLNKSCEPEHPSQDYGFLYAAAIIEPYTHRTHDGFDVYWAVSSWNPYSTLFVRSHIRASK